MKNYFFIGNEAVAFNLSSYILFKSLLNETESFYRADSENGDGISVAAGHKLYSIFAFAENCWNSKIFIVNYPDFQQISVFEPKEECVYIGLEFSENEHLIALTGMPNYCLQVWLWRTHDLLISKKTEMITDKQTITCSHSLPLTVAQFANVKGELIVWEVHGTQKFCKLIKRKIELNLSKDDGPFRNVYTVEGNILVVNKNGEIFYVIPSTGSVNSIVKCNGDKSDSETCIAFIRNGALVACPDGNLKYFKRQKFLWNEIFQMQSPSPFVVLKGYLDNEAAIGTTNTGALYKLILNEGEKLQITKLHQYDSIYKNFVYIYPHGDHLITVNSLNCIHAIEVKSGEIISQLLENIQMTQVFLKANPRYPFVAIGNLEGNIYCVSLHDPKNPTLLTEFLLSRQSINAIRFSNDGNFMIVNDIESNFFIISCTPGEKMSVLHHFKEDIPANEFYAIESRTSLSIMFLTRSQNGSNDKIMKLLIQLDYLDAEIERFEWELAAYYNTIIPIFNIPDTLYAIRKNSKFIEVLELNNDDSITLCEMIKSPHQMKFIEGWNDGHHLVTWSIDGIVAIYDLQKNHELLTCFVAGNRHTFGIKKAKCDTMGEFAISLDHSGNLICSKLDIRRSEEQQKEMRENLERCDVLVAEKFSKTTSGGFPGLSQEYGAKKYTDLKDEKAYQMEAEESEETRILLFKKLDELRKQIKVLLDENKANVESEKLEIQEFNLNLIATAKKEEEAKLERDQQDRKMMDYINAQSAMNKWMIEKCWDHLAVKGTKLRGMFLSSFVENYPLLPDKSDNELERIELIRSIENSVARDDCFLAWRPISTL